MQALESHRIPKSYILPGWRLSWCLSAPRTSCPDSHWQEGVYFLDPWRAGHAPLSKFSVIRFFTYWTHLQFFSNPLLNKVQAWPQTINYSLVFMKTTNSDLHSLTPCSSLLCFSPLSAPRPFSVFLDLSSCYYPSEIQRALVASFVPGDGLIFPKAICNNRNSSHTCSF